MGVLVGDLMTQTMGIDVTRRAESIGDGPSSWGGHHIPNQKPPPVSRCHALCHALGRGLGGLLSGGLGGLGGLQVLGSLGGLSGGLGGCLALLQPKVASLL